MSILAAAAAGNLRDEMLFAAICLAVGLGVAAVLRRWGPPRAGLPVRVPRRSSIWPLAVVTIAAVFCWLTISGAIIAFKKAVLIAQEGPAAELDIAKFSPREVAVLAIVPPLATFFLLLAGDSILRRFGRYDLGFGLLRLRTGIRFGLLGSVCVVPFLFGFMILLEWGYRLVHYQHPTEHDLLRALGGTNDPTVQFALLGAATLLAPFFEELLFRAHLQTVLRYALAKLDPNYSRPPGDPRQQGEPAGPPAVEARASLGTTMEAGEVAPPGWATWGAIALTSGLFVLVHPLWTAPPIFLLSLCLGYAYERTGNLWVPIMIHAVFNITSTVMFLWGLAN